MKYLIRSYKVSPDVPPVLVQLETDIRITNIALSNDIVDKTGRTTLSLTYYTPSIDQEEIHSDGTSTHLDNDNNMDEFERDKSTTSNDDEESLGHTLTTTVLTSLFYRQVCTFSFCLQQPLSTFLLGGISGRKHPHRKK